MARPDFSHGLRSTRSISRLEARVSYHISGTNSERDLNDGLDFTVLLDTGSTDLWVSTSRRALRLTNSSGLVTGIGYGSGEVKGTIDFAELKIGDFAIPSQGT